MSLIQFSTKIHFADDVLEEALEVEAGSLGLQRPLLVVDRSAAASGIVDRLFDALRARSATLFAARHHDATETDARAAADLYHEGGLRRPDRCRNRGRDRPCKGRRRLGHPYGTIAELCG